MKTLSKLAAFAAITALGLTSKAVTIDFGTDLEAADSYLGTSYWSGNGANTEADIATVINSVAGTTFVAGDILKTDNPTELGAPDGQFAVAAGYDWLLAKYDGKNAGYVVFWLGGNDALVPFDSAPLWGDGDQYAVSHFAVAGPHTSVPDGGMTAVLLGLALLGLGVVVRRRA